MFPTLSLNSKGIEKRKIFIVKNLYLITFLLTQDHYNLLKANSDELFAPNSLSGVSTADFSDHPVEVDSIVVLPDDQIAVNAMVVHNYGRLARRDATFIDQKLS